MARSPTASKPLRELTIEEYCLELDSAVRGFSGMNIAAWKLAQNTIISILVFWLALAGDADPTIAVVIIAAVNGVVLADLAALMNVSTKMVDGVSVTVHKDDDPDPTDELTESESAESNASDDR